MVKNRKRLLRYGSPVIVLLVVAVVGGIVFVNRIQANAQRWAATGKALDNNNTVPMARKKFVFIIGYLSNNMSRRIQIQWIEFLVVFVTTDARLAWPAIPGPAKRKARVRRVVRGSERVSKAGD